MGIIRVLLAFTVVLDHFNMVLLNFHHYPHVEKYWVFNMDAGHAVMYFYIISGFLVAMVWDRKYAAMPDGTKQFYLSRAIRIYSLYLPLYFAALYFLGTQGKRTLLDIVTGTFLLGADWRLGFTDYPNQYFMMFALGMNPAWSLAVEMSFYLVAPWLLRSQKRVLAALVLSALLRMRLVYLYGFSNAWTYTFFPSTLVFFLLGVYSYRQLPATISSLRFWGLWVVIALCSLQQSEETFDSIYFWVSVMAFMQLLPRLFAHTKKNVALNGLGALTYPIYLSHVFPLLITPLWKMFGDMLPLYGVHATLAVYLAVMIGGAVVLHLAVEKPCAAWLHRLFSRRREHAPVLLLQPALVEASR